MPDVVETTSLGDVSARALSQSLAGGMLPEQSIIDSLRDRIKGVATGSVYGFGDVRPAQRDRVAALDVAIVRAGLSAAGVDPVEIDRISGLVSAEIAEGDPLPPGFTDVVHSIEIEMRREGSVAALMERRGLEVLTGCPLVANASEAQRSAYHLFCRMAAQDAEALQETVYALLSAVPTTPMGHGREQIIAELEARFGCPNVLELGLEAEELVHAAVPSSMLKIKRVFDLFGALTLAVLLSPLLMVIFILLLREGWPIFYSQRRIGLNGRIFPCHKFRTMVPNAEGILADLLRNDPVARAEWDQFEKLRKDPRITRVGAFLRRTSLDELPQLWNVMKGEMSFVGPRPMAVHERDRWGSHYRLYKALRPGITGPWQVLHRTDSEYRSRLTSVVDYVHTWSLFQDFRLLWLTLKVPFLREGAY